MHTHACKGGRKPFFITMLVMLDHPKPFKCQVQLIFKFYFYNHSNSLNIDDHFIFYLWHFFVCERSYLASLWKGSFLFAYVRK